MSLSCLMVCFVMYVLVVVCFFFFKQKTAYEMRISDWSSDVCSSDLGMIDRGEQPDPAEADDEHPGAVDKAAIDRRGADADEEHRHHAARAPAVGEPADRKSVV